MEEAARMSGATVIQTILRISLKLAFPAILAFSLFAFILNLEAFEVPALIGMPGRVNVLTTDVYQAVKEIPPRVGFASAFSVVMLVIISALLYFYGRISRYAERFATITGKGYRPRPIALGRLRWAFSAIILVNFAVTLLLPLIAMVWMSVMPYVQPMRWQALSTATLQNFGAVLTSSYYLSLVTTTLMVAAISATVTMLITLIAGWLAARRAPGGQAIDQLVVVPLIFPGVVLGVALLEVALRLPFSLYGTMWLIILAFIIHYMPFGMRYTYAGVVQIHPELEQAARVSGARGWAVLSRILVPLLAPALASGWLFIFLLSSKEMSLPLLLAGPNSQTISVAMFDLWGNGQIGEVAALGLFWAVLMTLFGAAFFLISRRQSSMTFGV
jgi:iron(III) transport system permease protein